VWADTTPSVVKIEHINISVSYTVGRRKRQCKIPFKIIKADGIAEFWDIAAEGANLSDRTAAQAARQDYSASVSGRYRLFAAEFFKQHALERRNRLAVQALLHAGLGRATNELELAICRSLGPAPTSIQQLAIAIPALHFDVLLAVCRLWLKCQVEIPLLEAAMSPNWQITKA